MKLSLLFRNWWVILLQGVLMIVLSIIIFNNPDTVLAAFAFWLGLMVLVSGLVGVIAWLVNVKEIHDLSALFASLVMLLFGVLMISKMVATMKAITLVFGLLVTVVGFVLISGSWKARRNWSLWWLIALMGASALIVGIKSILDIYSGAENISLLIGISVLLSGIGLICMAFLKKKFVTVIGNRATPIRSQMYKRNLN